MLLKISPVSNKPDSEYFSDFQIPCEGIADNALSTTQVMMYKGLNDFSKKHSILGRLAGIPVAVLDIGIETLKPQARAIEALAWAVINLVGYIFNAQGCSYRDAIKTFEKGLGNLAWVPVAVAVAEFKLIYQLVYAILFPERVNPFCADKALSATRGIAYAESSHRAYRYSERVVPVYNSSKVEIDGTTTPAPYASTQEYGPGIVSASAQQSVYLAPNAESSTTAGYAAHVVQ